MSEPKTIEWRGDRLQAGTLEDSPELKSRFESWLERRQFEAVARNRAALGEEGFRAALREAIQSAAAGELQWGAPVAHRALWGRPGMEEIAYLAVQRHNREWTRRQHAELCADEAKLAELLALVHGLDAPAPEKPKHADHDPRPAPETAG